MVARLSRPFRIIALPLVRIPHGPLRARSAPTTLAAAAANANGSGVAAATGVASSSGTDSKAVATTPEDVDSPLVLYHVQQPDVQSASGPPPIVNRALEKASDAWLKLGEKKEGTVMRWFYDKGESLMDRMDYEEWALKNVHEGKGCKIADTAKGEVQEKIVIPLFRPGSVTPPLIPKLHRQLLHRIPHHKKMMYRFLVTSPLTWPFAIIPIIPNFPLFYVLWRAWSHYKAWRGALYLESLLKQGMIVDKESADLDALYKRHQIESGDKATATPSASSPASSLDSTDGPTVLASDQEPRSPAKPELPPYNQLLICADDVTTLEKVYALRPSEVIDIERAIEQADHRASEAEKVLRLQAEGAAKK